MKKRILAFLLVAMLLMVTSAVAFAAEVDITTLMTAGVEKVQSDLMSILAIVVPVLLAIVGVVVGIRFGMKYLKKVGS